MLTLAIASAGYACKVTDHTFKGMYKSDAYHLSGCTNGDAYRCWSRQARMRRSGC